MLKIIIELNDVLIMGAYFLMVFFQFFSVFFIISYFSIEIRTRLLFGVSSPFIFIILGYPFKVLGRLDFFAIFQLSLFLVVFFLTLKNKKTTLKIFRFRKPYPVLFFMVYILHFLSFEARTNYSYAFRDMTTSHMLIKSIIFETAWGYQPGLAIYLAPVYQILDPAASLDYLGFAIGLVLLVYVAILLEIIKKYLSLYFIVLLTLPFFTQNQYYLIGLSNNQFFILYIPLIIYLIYRIKDFDKESKFYLVLISLIMLSLTITSPSVSYYIGYFLVLFLITLPIVFNYSLKRISFILLNYIFGIGIYFFDMNIKPIQTVDFLSEQVFADNSTVFTTISTADSTADSTTYSTSNSIFLLLWDFLKLKFLINPFDSYFNAVGYMALLITLAVCIYSLLVKNLFYFLLSGAGVFSGFSTLTGIGQYSFIIGRIGWFYILIVIILASSIILNLVFKYSLNFYILILGIFIIIFNSLNPPSDYRFDNEDIHIKVYNLVNESKSPFYLFSTLYDNRIYHFKKNVLLINDPQAGLGQTPYADLSEHLKNCKKHSCATTIVLIDKSLKLSDPILTRSINRVKINDDTILKEFYSARNKILETNINLERMLIQNGFIYYYNDINNSILIKY
jgi:hypothetical protein